jgi:hypothetical protein
MRRPRAEGIEILSEKIAMFGEEIGGIRQHKVPNLLEEGVLLRGCQAPASRAVNVQVPVEPLLVSGLHQAAAELPTPSRRQRLPPRWPGVGWGKELEVDRA